jgi:hypothetical protein
MFRKVISVGMVFVLVTMIFMLGPINLTARAADEGNYEAYFRGKTTGIPGWGPYTRLSSTPTYTCCVMVAANDGDPGHVVVVFADNLTGQFDWYFTESLDSGVTWSAPAIAVDPTFDIYVSDMFGSALDMGSDGVVHLSFARQKQYDTNQPTGIYYTRYDGTAWAAPILVQENLSPGKLKLYTNDITIGENHDTIHIAYGSDLPGNDNGDTWYSRSTDGGLTWSVPVNINSDNGMDVGYRPSLAADANGNVYKANDGGWPGWIWFRRSQDSGNTWDNHLQVGKTPYEHRKPLVMCDNNGGVYTVYMREAPGEYTLMYKYSSDYGSTWAPSQEGGYILKSSVSGMGSWYLAELEDAYIHIVYGSTETGVMEAYYMKIDTAGNIINPPEIITPDDGNPSYPTGLSVRDGHVYFSAKDYVLSAVPPTIDIDPDTLNLKSKGRWITCYIDFEDPFNESGIDISTVAITDVNGNPVNILALWGDMQYDASGESLLMCKFDRSDVQDVCDLGNTTITVYGEMVDGSSFQGSDTIRVIDPP